MPPTHFLTKPSKTEKQKKNRFNRSITLFQDLEVPYQQSLTLCQALASNDVDMIFRKNGPHQLDQPVDVEIFLNTLDRMLKDHPIRA